MGHPSSPQFRTFHALRIRGLAGADMLADTTQQAYEHVEEHLHQLSVSGLVEFREDRARWQLTSNGRTAHLEWLHADTAPVLPNPTFTAAYEQFLRYHGQFEELCGAWQLVDSQPNDHSDAGHDAAVIENLAHLHAATEPVVAALAGIFDRMAPYGPRLESVLVRIQNGESNMFTGVMCGSYHNVWTELHDDLILTQGMGRGAEGRS